MRDLEQRIRRRLAEIDAAGLRRNLRPPAGVDLSSNDYLGLATHPVLKQRMAQAVMEDGCGSTASRLLRGHRESFSSLERRFAVFKGTEAALYFSSGYLANLGVLTALLEEGDVVFSDELNHASLIDGLRLSPARRVIVPHCDVDGLRKLLAAEENTGRKLVVTESLFSMDGDEAPLAEYAALCRETGAALIVDEAHAVGVYGAHGSGLIEEAGIADAVFVSVNTAGKALGVGGAFAAGSSVAMDYLVQRARPFIFSTAPPPAMASALEGALEVVAGEPQRRAKLLENAAFLRQRLLDLGLRVPPGRSQIIPVMIGENEKAVAVAAALGEQGFDVRAIRPPSVPPGTARLRVSVNASLDQTTLERFAAALAKAVASITPCSVASS
jgi:8-amino-7-oxononanoate synthase